MTDITITKETSAYFPQNLDSVVDFSTLSYNFQRFRTLESSCDESQLNFNLQSTDSFKCLSDAKLHITYKISTTAALTDGTDYLMLNNAIGIYNRYRLSFNGEIVEDKLSYSGASTDMMNMVFNDKTINKSAYAAYYPDSSPSIGDTVGPTGAANSLSYIKRQKRHGTIASNAVVTTVAIPLCDIFNVLSRRFISNAQEIQIILDRNTVLEDLIYSNKTKAQLPNLTLQVQDIYLSVPFVRMSLDAINEMLSIKSIELPYLPFSCQRSPLIPTATLEYTWTLPTLKNIHSVIIGCKFANRIKETTYPSSIWDNVKFDTAHIKLNSVVYPVNSLKSKNTNSYNNYLDMYNSLCVNNYYWTVLFLTHV